MKYFYEKLGERNLIIVHHNDMDGYLSASMVTSCRKQRFYSCSIDYIPRNYNHKWDIERFRDRDVVIVDISFTKQTIGTLMEICKIAHEVRWIDHHESSKDVVSNNNFAAELDRFENLQYAVNTNLCATLLMEVINGIETEESLTFENLENVYREHNLNTISGVSIREISGSVTYSIVCGERARLVDSWDRFVWKKEDNMDAVYLNSAFYALDHRIATRANNDNFFAHINDDMGYLLSIGKTVFNAKEADVVRALNSGYIFKIMDGKYDALVVNAAGINPNVTKIDRFRKYNCDVIIIWRYAHNTHNFIYSVYTREGVNAVEVAQYFEPSGGGHIGASGFVSDKMLFT